MLLNLIVFVLIILTTLYLSTQGMLSSLLALATATFSSILAMAIVEPLQFLVASWRPEYGRGVTFLVLFLATFSITRVLADMAVPENIKLSTMVNRITGGAIGFITALVVVGTILLGVQMLPLPRTLLGFDRFPDSMAASELGEVNKNSSNIWFAPDKFVQLIWKGASRRALGGNGNYSWSDIHPDLTVESYGYRNNVWKASLRTVPSSLFSVTTAWTSNDAKEFESLGLPIVPGRGRVVMVRTEVKKGEKAPETSNDPEDSYFRVTPTQVRMVSNKQRQYYPVGYLEQGRKFQPLPLDSGHLVEDYASGGGSRVVEDWIFLIGDDEMPTAIEMKQFGRADLAANLKERRPSPLAASAYPPRAYLKELTNITINFNPGGKKLESAKAYLVPDSMAQEDIESEIRPAFDKIENILTWMGESSHGWSKEAKPGVPDSSFFGQASRFGQNIKTDQPDKPETWQTSLQVLLAGQAEPDGERNLNIYPTYFNERFVTMLRNAKKGTALRNSADAGPDGKAEIGRVIAGSYSLICTMKTDRGFYVWLLDANYQKAGSVTHNLSPTGSPAPLFKIDLDAAQ